MAPISQAASANGQYDGSCARYKSLAAWLKAYGRAEYAIWKRNNAPAHLSYEEWGASEHVLGPYLWHATLDVWEEVSSSDEEPEVEAPKPVSRSLPVREPARKRTASGNGLAQVAGASASPVRKPSSEDPTSAKKRRRPRKKYLSEEIVASDDSDEIEEPVAIVEAVTAATAPTPTISANGRRKSGGRKKKQFLSEETISPEDLEDDAMSVDVVAIAARVESGPIDSERLTPLGAPNEDMPKPKSGRRQRRKYLSEEIVSIDDDEDTTPGADADANVTGIDAPASPDTPITSSAPARRGLRARTAAQQRPYFHHAKLFEEQESSEQDTESSSRRSPQTKPTKLAQVSYPEQEDIDMDADPMDADPEDSIALLIDDPPGFAPKRHYKGKGRAWKKAEEDEDQDYVSPVKTKISGQQKRTGKPRKSTQLSESYIQSEAMSEAEECRQKPGTGYNPTDKAVNLKTRRPRKTLHLSEEYVRDDTESEADATIEAQDADDNYDARSRRVSSSPIQKTPRTKGKSMNADQGMNSKDAIVIDDKDHYASGQPKSTPKVTQKKMRGSIVSLGELSDRKTNDATDKEDVAEVATPVRKARQRKSQGLD